jgi:hypothetical protein
MLAYWYGTIWVKPNGTPCSSAVIRVKSLLEEPLWMPSPPVSGVHGVVDRGGITAGDAVRPVLRDGPDPADAGLDDRLGVGIRTGWHAVVHRVAGGTIVGGVQRGVDLEAAGGQQIGPVGRGLAECGVAQQGLDHVIAGGGDRGHGQPGWARR